MKQEIINIARERARELRKNQTNAERIFWDAVRNRKFMNKKFLRQHPLLYEQDGIQSFFITDFFCHENNLVIEIDGNIHDNQKERDKIRTYIIECLDLRVVRFTNGEIENNLSKVLVRLEKYIRTHP
jgi:very-short-patch-repair endonuclease